MSKPLGSISQQPPASYYRNPNHNRNTSAKPCHPRHITRSTAEFERLVNKPVKYEYIQPGKQYQPDLRPENRIGAERLCIGNEEQQAGRNNEYQPPLRPGQQMLRQAGNRQVTRKTQQAQIEKERCAYE